MNARLKDEFWGKDMEDEGVYALGAPEAQLASLSDEFTGALYVIHKKLKLIFGLFSMFTCLN